MAYKPIVFNNDMVKAILEGRKTQTRRLVKDFAGKEKMRLLKPDDYGKYVTKDWREMVPDLGNGKVYCIKVYPPCEPGDILWVRETWHKDAGRYMYRANYAADERFFRNGREVQISWEPPIYMPKEAARLFLRVKDVRPERLQDIGNADAIAEGFSGTPCHHECADPALGCTDCLNTGWLEAPLAEFAQLWDSNIKPADLDKYGWAANPFVWVIEFERCEKPEGW